MNLNANCVDFWSARPRRGQPVAYSMDPETRYVTVEHLPSPATTTRRRHLAPAGQERPRSCAARSQQSLGEPVSVTIHDPPMFAATVLAETLAASGVAVTRRSPRATAGARERYADDQQPVGRSSPRSTRKLSTVLERANKDSMNLYAEALCKRLGREASGQPGSWANGTAAMGEFLKRSASRRSQFKLDDGCGLSRENAISADAHA